MGRWATFTRIVALSTIPAVIAATFWDSGLAAMVAVFLLMILVDALLLAFSFSLQGKRE